MVVGLFLAAAVSAGAVKPLFVPPKGMTLVAEDARTREEVLRARGTFVREYRGFAKVKPSWSTFTYKTPESILIVTRPSAQNAAEWGARTLGLAEMTALPSPAAQTYCKEHHCTLSVEHVKVLASRPIALCNGQRGWFNVFTHGDETYQQVLARSRNHVYIAFLRYQTAAGDESQVAQSLRTLCPPHIGELPAPTTSVPLPAPLGWTRSTSAGSDVPEFTALASWYRQTPRSYAFNQLQLLSTSDVSEYTTPEQMASMWNATVKQATPSARVLVNRPVTLCAGTDGWMTDLRIPDRAGRLYDFETVFGYGNDTLYALQYRRVAAFPKDPAADKALRSLCPPQSTNGVDK